MDELVRRAEAEPHPIDTSRIIEPGGRLRPRLLTELLDRAMTEHPERIALDFLGKEYTYAQLGAEVDRVARGLQDAGLGQGDRVGLCFPNTPYSVIVYFAVLRAGGVVVNINPLYAPNEIAHLIADSGAKFIATVDLEQIHGKIADCVPGTTIEGIILCSMAAVLPPVKAWGLRILKRGELAKKRKNVRYLDYAKLAASSGSPEQHDVKPDDLAVLQYTGGTTGVPKGAMLSHANLAANSAQMLLHLGEERDVQERTLAVLPLFHVFALTCVLNYGVETAAELVLLPRFDMDEVLKAIKRKPPTQFFGVPTMFNALGALPEDKVPDLSMVRSTVSGGAPLPLDIRQKYEKACGSPVVEGYGLTEASPIIACNPLLGRTPVKENSCGPHFPHTVIEIRDPETGKMCFGTGEKGEVCARGPQVMLGYWNRPDATERTFIEGALKTGDIGYLDEDGYLFLVDRMKDLILCSGYNVYPRVIEDAAYEHPAVLEAVAIGVPDAYRGEAPKLFIAVKEGESLTEAELCSFLESRLNKIEMPDHIEFRKELPKTLIGKLSKKELVEEERAKREAQEAA